MPLTERNVETAINMLTALTQRQDTLRQLTQQIHVGNIWRSPDGTLAVPITDAQRTELEAFIKTYLDESEVLIAAVRTLLAPLPGGAGGAP